MVPHPCVAAKNWEDYLSYRGPLRSGGVPVPYETPQLRVLVLGREVPRTSSYENQWGLWLSEKEGFWSPRQSS